MLRALSRDRGMACEIVGMLAADEEEVSSSSIRRLLGLGDLTRVEALLGRCAERRGHTVPFCDSSGGRGIIKS